MSQILAVIFLYNWSAKLLKLVVYFHPLITDDDSSSKYQSTSTVAWPTVLKIISIQWDTHTTCIMTQSLSHVHPSLSLLFHLFTVCTVEWVCVYFQYVYYTSNFVWWMTVFVCVAYYTGFLTVMNNNSIILILHCITYLPCVGYSHCVSSSSSSSTIWYPCREGDPRAH